MASRSEALTNTEWLSDGAYAMTCAHCSCIQWFGARPQRLDPQGRAPGYVGCLIHR